MESQLRLRVGSEQSPFTTDHFTTLLQKMLETWSSILKMKTLRRLPVHEATKPSALGSILMEVIGSS